MEYEKNPVLLQRMGYQRVLIHSDIMFLLKIDDKKSKKWLDDVLHNLDKNRYYNHFDPDVDDWREHLCMNFAYDLLCDRCGLDM